MPPKNAAPKYPRPIFKPPRPVSQSDQPVAPKRQTSKNSIAASRPSAQQSANSRATAPEPLDSDDEQDTHEEAPGNKDTSNHTKTMTFPDSPAIPHKLLARLLHEHFVHDDTRITKEAMALFAKYVELFAREAIARAISERREATAQGRGSALGVDFLEVEDLERLAPQLLLDFQ